MTATTVHTALPARRTTGRDGVTFPRVLAAEWIKFRSLRSTVWTLATTVVVMVGIGFLIAATTASIEAEDLFGTSAATASLLVTASTYFAQLALAVLGVLVITGEYTTGQIRSTLAAVPRRLPALWAKAVVVLLAGALVAAVATGLLLAVSAPFLSRADASLDLADPATLRVLGGGVLYLATIAVFAFAIGAILRHSAGALATVLGLLVVVETVFAMIPHQFFRTVSPFLPGTAGSQLMMDDSFSMPAPDGVPELTAWQGYGVLVAWVVVLLATAAVLLRRRDA